MNASRYWQLHKEHSVMLKMKNAFMSVAASTITLRCYEFHSRIENLFPKRQQQRQQYKLAQNLKRAPPVTNGCPHSCFLQIPTWLMAAAVLTAFSLSSACDI
jgi:hypothetical protein